MPRRISVSFNDSTFQTAAQTNYLLSGAERDQRVVKEFQPVVVERVPQRGGVGLKGFAAQFRQSLPQFRGTGSMSRGMLCAVTTAP